MFSGFAWGDSITSTDLTELDAIPDPEFFTTGKDVSVPDSTNRLLAIMGVGSDLKSIRLTSPTLRAVAPITPGQFHHADTIDGYYPVYSLMNNQFQMQTDEQVRALAANDAATADSAFVGALVSDGNVAPLNGATIITVSGTAAVTASSENWVTGQITLDTILPRGVWAVVGAKAVQANGVFARLVFSGQGVRPMFPIVPNPEVPTDQMFRGGKMGLWGTFDSRSPPKLQVLSSGAASAQQVYLDVTQVRAG